MNLFNLSKTSKKFLSLLLLSTFIFVAAASTYAETIPSSDQIEDMFFKVFQEGKEVNKDSVGLNDFIINPNHDYYIDISFVSSIADYDNQLCYFTFDKSINNPEELLKFSASDIKSTGNIFESIKNTNPGDVKKIGPFKKAEKVGFYIVSPDGDFYSIRSLNETESSHCAKYKDQIDGEYFVSLGFEDKVIEKSDKDYNDTIFLINVDNYSFPDVPDKDDIEPSPEPDQTAENTTTPEVTSTPDETSSNDEIVTPDEESTLPKTGEESSSLFIITGALFLIAGLLSLYFFRFKKSKI